MPLAVLTTCVAKAYVAAANALVPFGGPGGQVQLSSQVPRWAVPVDFPGWVLMDGTPSVHPNTKIEWGDSPCGARFKYDLGEWPVEGKQYNQLDEAVFATQTLPGCDLTGCEGQNAGGVSGCIPTVSFEDGELNGMSPTYLFPSLCCKFMWCVTWKLQ